MNLKKNIKTCVTIEKELFKSLTAENIEDLRRDCALLGKIGWLTWRERYRGVILEIVALPVSVRREQDIWQPSVIRQRLVLAGIQHVRNARELLFYIDRNNLFPDSGGTERDMVSRAAKAFDDLLTYSAEKLWPFPGPDPFESPLQTHLPG